MMNKLLTYLLSIFYRVEKETPLSIQAWTSQPGLVPKAEENLVEPQLKFVKKPVKKSKPIDKDRVMTQIKNNIYFLETLIVEMEAFAEYSTYVVKLRDMKEQSQGCLRILFRMKEDAPYFAHTLKTVYSHTKTISQLMED
jgi:hypothetical protein